MGDRQMDQPRLLFPADNFQLNAARMQYPVDQQVAVGCLPRRARRNGTHPLNAILIRNVLETQEGYLGLLDRLMFEISLAENVLAQPYRQANVLKRGHLPGFIHFANHHAHGV